MDDHELIYWEVLRYCLSALLGPNTAIKSTDHNQIDSISTIKRNQYKLKFSIWTWPRLYFAQNNVSKHRHFEGHTISFYFHYGQLLSKENKHYQQKS